MNVNLIMITEDRLLKKKCRAKSVEHWKNKKNIRNKEKTAEATTEAAGLPNNVILHVIDSPKFADMIMFEYFKKYNEEKEPDIEEILNKDSISNSSDDDDVIDNEMACLKQEVELLSEINLLKSKLKKGTGLKRKLVDKVRQRIQTLETMLVENREKRITAAEATNDNDNDINDNTNIEGMLDRASEVLDKSLNLRKKSKAIRNKMLKKSGELEVTWERVILAEKFRQSLITKKTTEAQEKPSEGLNSSIMSSLTTEYVNYINSR